MELPDSELEAESLSDELLTSELDDWLSVDVLSDEDWLSVGLLESELESK